VTRITHGSYNILLQLSRLISPQLSTPYEVSRHAANQSAEGRRADDAGEEQHGGGRGILLLAEAAALEPARPPLVARKQPAQHQRLLLLMMVMPPTAAASRRSRSVLSCSSWPVNHLLSLNWRGGGE
jgi:hypothetical protein